MKPQHTHSWIFGMAPVAAQIMCFILLNKYNANGTAWPFVLGMSIGFTVIMMIRLYNAENKKK